jgi:hypothetical protein
MSDLEARPLGGEQVVRNPPEHVEVQPERLLDVPICLTTILGD